MIGVAMKKVVPSTPCEFTVFVKRQFAGKSEKHDKAKFGSVREAINRMVAEWDTPDNRVIGVSVTIKIGDIL